MKNKNKKMKLIRKTLEVDIQEVDEQEGIVKAILSSGMPDRQGEMIDQSSWKLDEYRKNPVVLWSHNSFEPAIAQMISIAVNSDGMLEGVMKFAIKEYDFARTIFNLYAGKFIRGFSVGFVSDTQDEINGIKVLKDNTLYEVSGVNIGADALALAKSKGIDISSIEKKTKPKKKSPECREEDETKDECVSRKIPEIMNDDPEMEQDQAIAIAESMCSKKCAEKALDEINDFLTKEGRVLSTKNRSIIEKARDTLSDVLKMDEDSRADKGVKHRVINYRRIINKAVRELLKVKKE